MREILFRGKRWNDGEWLEGTLYRLAYEFDPFIMLANRHGESYQVKPETVGQFTGLTDKNGKKVFEGDIIKAIASNPVGEDVQATVIVRLDDYELMWDIEHSHEIEVIGNIHDNPELLKGT